MAKSSTARPQRRRDKPSPKPSKRAQPVATKPVTGGQAAFTGLFVPVERLAFYAQNARIHSPAQVNAIAASIKRFGFTNPVLADADGIVAGHGRVLASMQLYKAGESLALPGGEKIPANHVPVVDVSGWTADQRRAYILADNQLGDLSDYDPDLLREEAVYLNSADRTLLDDAGFDDDALTQAGLGADEMFAVPSLILGEGDTRMGAEHKPNKTEDGYVEFAVVLTEENKVMLTKTLNAIKKKQELSTQEEALMWMASQHGG